MISTELLLLKVGRFGKAVALGSLLSSCALPGRNPLPGESEGTSANTSNSSSANRNKITAGTLSAPTLQNRGRVDLKGVIETAVKNNLNVNIQRHQQEVAAAGVQAANGQFAPQFSGSLNRYPEGWTNMDGLLALEKTVSYTGTTVALEGGHLLRPELNGEDRADSIRGSSETDRFNGATMRVTQPLLKGADWQANRAEIEIGKLQLKDSQASTVATVLETLRTAETAYWTAAFASEVRKSQAASLDRTREILKIVGLRQREGHGTNLDVLEAEAAEAQARDGEARELKRYRDAVGTLWNSAGCKVDVPDPSLEFAPLAEAPFLAGPASAESVTARALTENPESLILANAVYRRERELRKAKNQALPGVDLDFAYGSNRDYSLYHNVAASAGDAPYDPVRGRDGTDWNIGLRVTLPWPRGEEQARVKAAQAELESSQLAREDGLRQLRKDIFETCWEIDASRQQIAAGQAGLSANHRKYTQMAARFKEGVASVRDVMEAENELRKASEVLLEARLRHTAAVVLLSRQDGSITRRHSLTI